MSFLSRLLAGLALIGPLVASSTIQAREQWTAQQAQSWYAQQPWLVGANYIPASAINQLEMWQAATFDPERIDRELGWAQAIGMNTMRVFLHDLLWQDAQGFKDRINHFLDIASKHHIRILFVLFDNCWWPEPHLGPQNPPIPGVHNSGWVQSPAMSALEDPSQEPRLEAYVEGIVGAFARDARILGWDVWNEPGGTKSNVPRLLALLPKVFQWARSVNPSQPLTSGVFADTAWVEGTPSALETVQLTESDVISFHDYHWPETFQSKVTRLLQRGRPVWCTEYLARGAGSTFEGSLPIGKRNNVAMINWGLVDGKTQTRLPWDSWQIPYTQGREPIVWHHDIFKADGTPYRQSEVDLIKTLSTTPKGTVATLAPQRSDVPATPASDSRLKGWEQGLRQAGASPAELKKLQWLAEHESDPASFEEYLRTTPARAVVKDLRRMVRNDDEPVPAAVFAGITPMTSCEALRSIFIPDTIVDSARVQDSDHSCRIAATIVHPPENIPIRIFVALPMRAWNGRFRGTGGSGYAGGFEWRLDLPVSKGYAVAATDTGNPAGSADFAIGPEGRSAWLQMRDNAYVGIHDMTVVGKALTESFYGKAPRYSYFVGAATGGRQALTEAQRYPQDYDGIVALAPAISRDRYVPAQLWPQLVMRDAHDYVSKEKTDAATAAAVKTCATGDGAIDRVISDPTQCKYDPAALVGTKVGGSVFTATDAEVISAIWTGPRSHDGKFLWWGPPRGAELSVLADSGGTPPSGKPFQEGLDWFRFFLALDPRWDWTTLSRSQFELLFEQSIEEYAGLYGGDEADLSGLRDHGGKLLIIHGWADQIVPPQNSVAYYQRVARRMGGSGQIEPFMRLFMVPGADHGFSTDVPMPAMREMVAAILNWVEHGQAPERLDAQLVGERGELVRTRFVYPFAGSGRVDF